MNQFRVTEEEVIEKAPEPKKENQVFKTISRFPDLLDFLSKEQVMKAMPYIFFITFLLILYITNSYYAEKNVREIDRTTQEIKELRAEYITIKSELMLKSRQSEIAVQVETGGLKESTVPPKKILIRKEN